MAPSPDVDAYLRGATRWPKETAASRTILLECGLTEAIKWNKPCYGHDGHSIVVVQEMRDVPGPSGPMRGRD